MNDLYYNHELRLLILTAIFFYCFGIITAMLIETVDKKRRVYFYKRMKFSNLKKR